MRNILVSFLVMLFIYSCSTVPITERKRVNIIDDSQILPASFAQYDNFLKENTLSKDAKMTREINNVGLRISKSVDRFMRANGMTAEANSYQWEFKLIQDDQMNAWCLPGGKVVFYTGILPICENTDGIAAVMGHEIAHAFAKHGQERMTSAYGQQLGGIAVAIGTSGQSYETQTLWNSLYGMSSQVGILAYSRTRPTNYTRIADLQKYLPIARMHAREFGIEK